MRNAFSGSDRWSAWVQGSVCGAVDVRWVPVRQEVSPVELAPSSLASLSYGMVTSKNEGADSQRCPLMSRHGYLRVICSKDQKHKQVRPGIPSFELTAPSHSSLLSRHRPGLGGLDSQLHLP